MCIENVKKMCVCKKKTYLMKIFDFYGGGKYEVQI